MHTQAPSSLAITGQILSIVFYTFLGFLCIGIPIAVVPGFVHNELGYGAVVAGLTIASQYLATLLTRPVAGRLADSLGTKPALVYGLCGIAVSGLLTLLSTELTHLPLLSLVVMLVARLLLGVTQGLLGVSTISWGINQVGTEYTARVISWNGIAAYGAIAIGAPAGVLMVDAWGFWTMGCALTTLALLGLLLIRKRASAPVLKGERLPFSTVLGRIAPYGVGLALGSIGYGTLTTFVALYFASKGWSGAAYSLSAFGVAFIGARVLLIDAIKHYGGYSVAIGCMGIETLGLLLLWFAPSPLWAMAGAALTGCGLSLVYPALGVEAIKQIPDSSRSAGFSAYAVFFDLALAIAGPLMGAVAYGFGYNGIFLAAALLAVLGLTLSLWLARRAQRSQT
ncbi:MFS transporter [Pseudomonas sp. GV071]|uniref:MFS transporter n=1 Tax=Pseudomonas sp. GV071 TaxID=2135754 RepID=UPI000D3C44AC|nr:MFS transporter [Pseudomonas sp. GV071]PTQ69079.1 putative MFS family arabinose efflux permease [Pseudomonas sp. GV071]